MPKKPYFESAIHHLLLQAKAVADSDRLLYPERYSKWEQYINSLEFTSLNHDTVSVSWSYPKKGKHTFSLSKAAFYSRGDTELFRKNQKKLHYIFGEDKIKQKNNKYFLAVFKKMSKKAGMKIAQKGQKTVHSISKIDNEEKLSDEWALSVNPKSIDVVQSNTACTSPELRYIHSRLGNVKGKRILDLGCGLGEASVYFALQGAHVTAVDLSAPMLRVVKELAKENHVTVRTIQETVEHLTVPTKKRFDIVYVGNLFHHVDIEKTLGGILKILSPEGILISWDPVGYNPIINLYRRIATKVRSHNERPFTLSDIDTFKSYFKNVSVRWFWLTPLIIFIIMVVFQRRNPNKERFWKAVVQEEAMWKPLYTPLEKLDSALLSTLPFMGLLCWNVCLVCRNPKTHK